MNCTEVICGAERYAIVGDLLLVNVYFPAIIMAALRSRCGHYIFILWFLLHGRPME